MHAIIQDFSVFHLLSPWNCKYALYSKFGNCPKMMDFWFIFSHDGTCVELHLGVAAQSPTPHHSQIDQRGQGPACATAWAMQGLEALISRLRHLTHPPAGLPSRQTNPVKDQLTQRTFGLQSSLQQRLFRIDKICSDSIKG